MLKRRPKLSLLTLVGVSKVSLVLAPLRVLSTRLVGMGCCANEEDRKALQTMSSVRQRLPTGIAQDSELNLESQGNREDREERNFPTSCDKWPRIIRSPI